MLYGLELIIDCSTVKLRRHDRALGDAWHVYQFNADFSKGFDNIHSIKIEGGPADWTQYNNPLKSLI